MSNRLFSQTVCDCIGENNIYMQIAIISYSRLFQLQMTQSKHRVTQTEKKRTGSEKPESLRVDL